jgi:importin subunit alpha-2
LCRNKIPPPSVPQLLPALAQLIHNDDEEILVDACSALSYLIDSPNELIQEVVNAGIVPQLITLLDNTKVAVISATLRTVSKIAAGNAIQIQALFTNNVVRPLMDVLGKGDFECQKEAAWVITNITSGTIHFSFAGAD